MTQFNADMLILAREVRAISQEAFADATKISQSKVSKIESGLLTPTDDELQIFAAELNMPLAFFRYSGRRHAPGSSCIYHRKRQSLPAKDLKRIHALMDWIRIQIETLFRGIEMKSPELIYRIDSDAFNGDVEGIAGMVRQAWGLPVGPVVNLTSAIENAGGIVVKTDFGTDKIDALSQWPKGSRPIFFVNSTIPGDRLRFSLAHELAHVIMHAIPMGDLEREADRFAAEFLMPARDIQPELLGVVNVQKLAALKPRWRTAMQALSRRAKDLHVISARQYRSLSVTISKMGWRKREPIQIDTEEPRLIRAVIDAYLTRRGYSIGQVSEMSLTLEKDFKAFHMRADPTEKPTLRLSQ